MKPDNGEDSWNVKQLDQAWRYIDRCLRSRTEQWCIWSTLPSSAIIRKSSPQRSKEIFRIISSTVSYLAGNPLPPAINDQTLANDFAQFVYTKVQKIRQGLDASDLHDNTSSIVLDYLCLTLVPSRFRRRNNWRRSSEDVLVRPAHWMPSPLRSWRTVLFFLWFCRPSLTWSIHHFQLRFFFQMI